MATSTDINTYFPDVSPAGSKIAGIGDLLIEILSRVPARSLFRFKCVSRNWRCLISDDRRFALLHTKRNPKGSCSGLFSLTSSSLASNSKEAKERKYDFILLSDSLRFAPPPPALSFLESLSCSRILQSSNGLLLCSSSRSDCAYFVCNPVLGQFRRLDLPNEVGSKRNWEVLGLTLAFDPSRWSGFKVICCMSRAIDVYSSETGNWKRLVEGAIQELNLVFEDGAYWNGQAFWLRKESSNFLQIDFPTYRVLNLENESFKEHILPCTYSMVYYFGESMGHLHLVTKDREAFNLFEMGENQEWMLKFKVMEHVMRKRLTGGYFAISNFVWGGSWVVSVVRKPEQRALEEDGYVVLWYLPSGAGRVVSYNCKTGLARK
ncbi:hypothetical protein V2J09_023510 [Rumex salicifolius]